MRGQTVPNRTGNIDPGERCRREQAPLSNFILRVRVAFARENRAGLIDVTSETGERETFPLSGAHHINFSGPCSTLFLTRKAPGGRGERVFLFISSCPAVAERF